MFSSILVPIDFSDGSVNALRLAVRLVHATGGHLTLLHVGVISQAFPVGAWGVPMPDTSLAPDEGLAEEHRHALERLARAEVPDDVHWSATVRQGYAPEEILAEAEGKGHDLV